MSGELHDQDGVFAGEPDQYDKADLGEDVVFHRTQPHAADRAQQAHRDDQNDRKRQRPAFVKRREQKKNEQNAQRENVNCAVAGELLLQRDFSPFGREACGQNLFSQTVNGCQRVASTRARCGLPAQVGCGKHVVACDLVGAAHFLHGRHRTERNNPTRIISRLQQANVIGT